MSRTRHHVKPHMRPSHYRWWAAEPKSWRKLMKHKKRRAAVRRCTHRVMREGPEAPVNWPQDKKPWIYYW